MQHATYTPQCGQAAEEPLCQRLWRTRAEDIRSHPYQSRPFQHGFLKIPGHAHGKVGQRQSRQRTESIAQFSQAGKMRPRQRAIVKNRRQAH